MSPRPRRMAMPTVSKVRRRHHLEAGVALRGGVAGALPGNSQRHAVAPAPHRQRRGQRDVHDAWESGGPLENAAMERACLVRAREPRVGGREPAVSRVSGSCAASTCWSRMKLRISRPEPTSSMHASPTSITTRPSRSRRRKRSDVTVREEPFIDPARSVRPACNAGERAENQAGEDRDAERESERAEVDAHESLHAAGTAAAAAVGAHASSRSRPGRPSAPPAVASSRLSVRNCRTMPAAARAERGADGDFASREPCRAPGRDWRGWRSRPAAACRPPP